MEVVMDNQELQSSIAKIANTLITTQRNGVTVSRSFVGGKDIATGTAPRL
jgi:hypothetical protein